MRLYVLIGIPGSGKSSALSDPLFRDAVIISTDSIRAEVFGDESYQGAPKHIFQTAYERTRNALEAGKDAAFDATNTLTEARALVLSAVRKIPDVRKVAVLVTPTLEQALARNERRARKVPPDVIRRMYAQLLRDGESIPEQFDDVIFIPFKNQELDCVN